MPFLLTHPRHPESIPKTEFRVNIELGTRADLRMFTIRKPGREISRASNHEPDQGGQYKLGSRQSGN
jgi:hypothetical protein